MAQKIHRLNARRVETLRSDGRHADGGGLYLSISKNGGRRWVFLYRRQGRLREMGLGSARDVPLIKARERAAAARLILSDGKDPLSERQQTQKSLAFAECATRYIASHRAGWRNEKHAAQWSSTLETYAYPIIGRQPVSDVDVTHVMQILEPIWATKTTTAGRLRGRIEAVLDWAKAHRYRTGENPARWRGHLDKLLPKRSKVQRVKHHPALPYPEIAAFVSELRERRAISARALEFLILTAARSGEVAGAKWCEIQADTRLWIIPDERMKAGKEHRVPLSARALAILQEVRPSECAPSDFIFPGGNKGEPLSENGMLALIKRMGRGDLTAHGFRSSFRDWAAECTTFSRDVAEMALAHTIADDTEAAYRRGDLLEKRRRLMEAWAEFCDTQPGDKVVSLRTSDAAA
jgi:integrase